jgi:hypothetical protein
MSEINVNSLASILNIDSNLAKRYLSLCGTIEKSIAQHFDKPLVDKPSNIVNKPIVKSSSTSSLSSSSSSSSLKSIFQTKTKLDIFTSKDEFLYIGKRNIDEGYTLNDCYVLRHQSIKFILSNDQLNNKTKDNFSGGKITFETYHNSNEQKHVKQKDASGRYIYI